MTPLTRVRVVLLVALVHLTLSVLAVGVRGHRSHLSSMLLRRWLVVELVLRLCLGGLVGEIVQEVVVALRFVT